MQTAGVNLAPFGLFLLLVGGIGKMSLKGKNIAFCAF